MKKSFFIYGNSIAAIVAGINLSQKKENKIFLLNKTNYWGGHFNTVSALNEEYDAGMFLFEFDHLTKENNLNPKRYDKKNFNNVQLYSKKIKIFCNKFVKTKKLNKVLIYYNKNFYNDYLISNDLSFLNKIDIHVKILKEIEKINIDKLKKEKIHSSQKRVSKKFLRENFKKISIQNHGKTFHNNFIEVFCKKVLFCSTEKIISKFHRVSWLPLYWPETIKRQILKKKSIKKINFEYSQKHSGTSITKNLVKKLISCRNVKIISKIDVKDVKKRNFLFAADQLEFQNIKKIKLKKNFSKASIGIFFMLIDKKNILKNFSVINVIDKDISFFRIVKQGNSALNKNQIKITIEFNIDYLNSLNQNNESIKRVLFKDLKKIKIFKNLHLVKCEIKLFKNTYTKPTLKNYEKYNYNFKKISAIVKKSNLLGQSAGFYRNSFNDQIIQGIKYG